MLESTNTKSFRIVNEVKLQIDTYRWTIIFVHFCIPDNVYNSRYRWECRLKISKFVENSIVDGHTKAKWSFAPCPGWLNCVWTRNVIGRHGTSVKNIFNATQRHKAAQRAIWKSSLQFLLSLSHFFFLNARFDILIESRLKVAKKLEPVNQFPALFDGKPAHELFRVEYIIKCDERRFSKADGNFVGTDEPPAGSSEKG